MWHFIGLRYKELVLHRYFSHFLCCVVWLSNVIIIFAQTLCDAGSSPLACVWQGWRYLRARNPQYGGWQGNVEQIQHGRTDRQEGVERHAIVQGHSRCVFLLEFRSLHIASVRSMHANMTSCAWTHSVSRHTCSSVGESCSEAFTPPLSTQTTSVKRHLMTCYTVMVCVLC